MKTWLHTIVLNTTRDWLRGQKGFELLPLEYYQHNDNEYVDREFPDPADTPEQSCLRQQTAEVLHDEINKLGPCCGDAIHLCMLQEVSHLEAADALKVSVTAVKSRIFRGKGMLRKRLSLRDTLRAGSLKGVQSFS